MNTLPEKSLRPEERYLLERYGPMIAGLLKYGSRAFGAPHRNSVHDFWVIVNDLTAFHRANEEFYRHGLNVPSTAEEQTAINRVAPNFYAVSENGLRMKLAVVSEEDFARLCRAKMMFVKGRMQKPLLVIRSTPMIDAAILAAREEGASHAVNLCPPRFTLETFFYQLCSLSYRAEIRPERKRAKIRSIIQAGCKELQEIYRPLLARIPYLSSNATGYLDARSPLERKTARKKTLGYLRRCRWSLNTLRLIWRNYRTHSAPFRYLWHKVLAEIENAWRRRRARMKSRR